MNGEILEKVLKSFESYYDINRNAPAPYAATAEFHIHNEQYVFVKAAKVNESDSSEYVYFVCTEKLSSETLTELSESTWKKGLEKIQPFFGHKNSDITLIILADSVENSSLKLIRKINYYKSYKWGFFGFSRFKLIAADLSGSRLNYNRFGSDYKKILNNII